MGSVDGTASLPSSQSSLSRHTLRESATEKITAALSNQNNIASRRLNPEGQHTKPYKLIVGIHDDTVTIILQ